MIKINATHMSLQMTGGKARIAPRPLGGQK